MHKAGSNFKCSTSPVSPIYGLAGFVMLASELWKQWTLTYAINDGHYIWWYLPFQLCSIPMYICLTLGILFLLSCYTDSSARRTTYCHISSRLQSFLMDFGLLGGIFAFFDTSGMHYGYLPLTIHSYAWHILLITLGFISGLDHHTDHTKKGLQFSVCLYLGCCLIATVLNRTGCGLFRRRKLQCSEETACAVYQHRTYHRSNGNLPPGDSGQCIGFPRRQ